MGTNGKRRSPAIVFCALALLVLVAGLTLAACGGPPPMAATPLPTPSMVGTLAFEKVTSRTDVDICVVNADGTGLRHLTQDPGLEECPSWSPDGSKIVYGAHGSVRVMNADGSGQAVLTPGGDPSWSPDGSQIAFTSYFQAVQGEALYVINADGTGLKRLTDESEKSFSPRAATWAPDGQILFLLTPAKGTDVYAINPDGSGLTPVTKSALVACFALSPDGTQLAIQQGSVIEVIPVAGGGAAVTLVDPLKDFMADNASLSWTPDGTAVATAVTGWEDVPVGSPIYIVHADGTGLSRVPGIDKAREPAWRPE